jgi:hypothetical protein
MVQKRFPVEENQRELTGFSDEQVFAGLQRLGIARLSTPGGFEFTTPVQIEPSSMSAR